MNKMGICCAIRNYCESIGEEPDIQDNGVYRFRKFFGHLPEKLVASLLVAGASVVFNGTMTTVAIKKEKENE